MVSPTKNVHYTTILTCSPNEVTFASRLKMKNASQIAERHFLEVPSDIFVWNDLQRFYY